MGVGANSEGIKDWDGQCDKAKAMERKETDGCKTQLGIATTVKVGVPSIISIEATFYQKITVNQAEFSSYLDISFTP